MITCPQFSIEDLVLDATYQLSAGVNIDYPSQWYVADDIGFIVITNRQDPSEIDEPEAGDIAIILLDLNSLRDELDFWG